VRFIFPGLCLRVNVKREASLHYTDRIVLLENILSTVQCVHKKPLELFLTGFGAAYQMPAEVLKVFFGKELFIEERN
jgi:hypothetical protein